MCYKSQWVWKPKNFENRDQVVPFREKHKASFRDFSQVQDAWTKVKLLRPVWLLGTPWTVAHQAPPSIGFSRQEYRGGLPFPSPRDLPTQESNWGLLHYRQILYQLSYERSLQDTWDHHKNHTEDELTVNVYKPYEKTCKEEKVTDGGNGSFLS